jgi:hypothetical protein
MTGRIAPSWTTWQPVSIADIGLPTSPGDRPSIEGVSPARLYRQQRGLQYAFVE